MRRAGSQSMEPPCVCAQTQGGFMLWAASERGGPKHREKALAHDRLSPVISAGLARPISSSIVGARSHRRPSERSCFLGAAGSITMMGRGWWCAQVNGSRFPVDHLIGVAWSAVTMALPPMARIASTTRPTHSSTVFTALFPQLSITPVWPTMSQLAKLRIIAPYLPDWMRFTASRSLRRRSSRA